jgi:hypothetical protein
MGNDLGAELPENAGTEMVVRVMMGQDHPLDRLPRNGPYGRKELLCLSWAGQGIDDDYPGIGYQKAGIGPPFRAPPGVADRGVHAWRQPA